MPLLFRVLPARPLQGFIRQDVKADLKKYTDENVSYKGLSNHDAVRHGTASGLTVWRTPRAWRAPALAPIHPGICRPPQPARQGYR